MTAAAIITVPAIITMPAAFTHPHLIIMVALALISLACIVAMINAIRKTRSRFGAIEGRHYLMIAGAVLGIGFMLIDNHPASFIGPLDRALITEPPEPPIVLTIGPDDCGPYTDGLTSQIIVTVEKRSDLAPLVTGCVRIAEKSYIVNAERAP